MSTVSETHARHKRNASQTLEHYPPRVPVFRPATPPSFEGKSVKELSEYEVGWKIYLEAIHTYDDEQRIQQAATYLKSYARDAWARRETTPRTWDEYILMLRTMVVDPANRIGYATLRLKEAKQRKD